MVKTLEQIFFIEALLCANQSLEDNQIEQGVLLSAKILIVELTTAINKFNKDDYIYLKFKTRFSSSKKTVSTI